ncbi:DUF3105 domain-containing protein [Dictyobacter arantiisoli]|uniref:Membrane protein n=1 Tax=Dictyobacter arantiisoli TaxID=2014874 RepID=A0A5A5T8H0_9CHLR|nr:DUF3105 domain-containing protein [Dictyobacter arantiisoli]GCF07565.1 membrane protein [Dictyobacter arantiisoli]
MPSTTKKSAAENREGGQRQQRQRRYVREQAKKRKKEIAIWSGVAVALVLIIGIIIYAVNSQQSPGDIAGVVSYSGLTRNHVTTKVNYKQNPPVGGDHNPVWLNCGVYDQPVQNENAVHALEHGAVWFTYQSTLSDDQIAQLRQLVKGHTYAILSPYNNLPAPIVASAWGLQLKVNNANDPRLAQFLKKYEQGPQSQEPGAACSGGTGNPISQ